MPDGSLAKEFFGRLKQRRLLKQVMRVATSTQLGDAVTVQKLVDSVSKEDRRAEHERNLCRELGVREGLLIVDYQSMKNPTYRAPGQMLTKEDIVVLTESGERQAFSRVSQIFSERVADPQKNYLCVYAPVDIEDRTERATKACQMHEVVRKHFGIR